MSLKWLPNGDEAGVHEILGTPIWEGAEASDQADGKATWSSTLSVPKCIRSTHFNVIGAPLERHTYRRYSLDDPK